MPSNQKNISISLIINGFALLHFATTLVCYFMRVSDTMLLTLLTMVMTLIICLRERQSIELSAIFIILVNIIGYAIGMGLQIIFRSIFGISWVNPCLSTLITTEMLGWGLFGFIRKFGRNQSYNNDRAYNTQIKWLVTAVIVIFILRFLITATFSTDLFVEHDVKDVISDFFDNSIVLILLIVLGILTQHLYRKFRHKWRLIWKLLDFCILFLFSTALSAVIVELDLPLHFNTPLDTKYFEELFVIALIVNAFINLIIYVIYYVVDARRSMEDERSKANMARFQYLKLKQQINPHFLFNSLNVLDALVCDGEEKEASTYIHKLSGMYRYMINNDSRSLVILRDELEFTKMYIDLMKVRFAEGLEVHFSIAEDAMKKYIVPASVQLLVENATKHNIISQRNPLKIQIYADDGHITVRNNLIPKLTPVQSTGLGQKYIRQQYLDICGENIRIEKNDTEYLVTLPLLETAPDEIAVNNQLI